MKQEYYSNCLIEAIKAKIKWGKQIKIIYIPSLKNEVFCPHFMWYDSVDGNVYDFHCDGWLNWYQRFWFKGYIRCRSYLFYKEWLERRVGVKIYDCIIK